MKQRKTIDGADLYRLGISYHKYGNIIDASTKRKTGFAFLCDTVTATQREQLIALCPTVQFRTSSPEYAPEMKSVAIVIPRTR